MMHPMRFVHTFLAILGLALAAPGGAQPRKT